MFENISYEKCLTRMRDVSWVLDDIFPENQKVGLEIPFLPSSLVFISQEISFLTSQQLLSLNHVSTYSYLHFFYFLEEFIVAKANQFGYFASTHNEQQAMSNFSVEEVKHQFLFLRVKHAIKDGLGFTPMVVNMEKEVTKQLMEISNIAALLFILHFEIITQDHYLNCIKSDAELEPVIVKVLKHHWMEECQHANLDYLMLESIIDKTNKEDQVLAIEAYVDCIKSLKPVFALQAGFDIDNLECLQKVTFSSEQRKLLEANQQHIYENIFIAMALNNQHFQKARTALFGSLSSIFPDQIS